MTETHSGPCWGCGGHGTWPWFENLVCSECNRRVRRRQAVRAHRAAQLPG